ncbi:MAG: branched-chain amino acid ABC transporter permease [Oscillospiraceae bacterium]|jgi:branched-chain amino acid transport system permease protein|nr:branched-chain amino acid ABC transporter permease [Oscillospiraceae bacterium]
MNAANRKSWIINLAALAALTAALLIPARLNMFNDYIKGVITWTLVNVIMAVSLNLVCGLLGYLALGHAGFMAVGAYASAMVSLNWKVPLSFPLALLAGGLAAAAAGMVIGIPVLRLKGDYLAIITLGFGEIVRIILNNIPALGGARSLRGIPRITTIPAAYLAVVICVALMFTLGRSRHGRAILSIREDEVAATSSGIPVMYYKMLAFTIAAFFAGIAGGLYAHNAGTLNPNRFNFDRSIEYLVMVVLGGMGSITGAVIAAAVLTALPEMLRWLSDYRMLIYSLALILMMLFRPDGLLGTAEFSIARMLERVRRARTGARSSRADRGNDG